MFTSKSNLTASNLTAAIADLKEAWGAVIPGHEPWAGIKTRSFRSTGYPTGMAFSPRTLKCLVVIQRPEEWWLTEWTGVPPSELEQSLRGAVSRVDLENRSGGFTSREYREPDAARASGRFVAWCREQTGTEEHGL